MEKIRNIIDIVDPQYYFRRNNVAKGYLTYISNKKQCYGRNYFIQKRIAQLFYSIVSSMFSRMNIIKRMYALNFGPNNIKNLIEIQGKKTKQISVFTSDP